MSVHHAVVSPAVNRPRSLTFMVEDLGQAERQLVGGLILLGGRAQLDPLTEADFRDPLCARIYATTQSMFATGSPVDEVTLSVALARSGDTDAAREVARLAGEAASSASVGYFAAHVLADAVRRQLLASGKRLAQIPPRPAEDLLRLAGEHSVQVAPLPPVGKGRVPGSAATV